MSIGFEKDEEYEGIVEDGGTIVDKDRVMVEEDGVVELIHCSTYFENSTSACWF